MGTIKGLFVALTLVGLLAGCEGGGAIKNTGPSVVLACLQDSSKTGDKQTSVYAPTTVTQTCDKSSNHNNAVPAEE